MATYAQVKANIAKLEKEAERLLRQEAITVIASIKKLMEKYKITAVDLGLAGTDASSADAADKAPPTKAVTATNARQAKKAATKKKPAAKYRDPKTGDTWSGMGKPPAWMRAAIAKGKRDQFLIGAAPAATAVKANTKPAVKAKGQKAKTAAKAAAKPHAAKKVPVQGKTVAAKAVAPKTAKAAVAKTAKKPATKAAAQAPAKKAAAKPAAKKQATPAVPSPAAPQAGTVA